jgi:SSS family solute:Na+ symporter
LWTAVILVPVAFCITFIGMQAAILTPQISPEQALPSILVSDILPPAVGALLLAALFSATMSSADTCLISTSTILTVDIIKKWKPAISERQTLVIARWAIVVIGLMSLLLALVVKGIISALMFAYTVYTCGVIVPVVAGYYRKRLKLTPAGAIAAIIGGGTLGIISKLTAVPYLDLGALTLSATLLFIISYIDNRFFSLHSRSV